MYIVNCKYYDKSTSAIFVTSNKEYAKSFCEKANILLDKIKEFFKSIDKKIEDIDLEENSNDTLQNSYLSLWCKYQMKSDIH